MLAASVITSVNTNQPRIFANRDSCLGLVGGFFVGG